MAPARKPAKRTEAQWEALSDRQRNRYISAGKTGTLNGRQGLSEAQVKRYYLSGKSLTAARRGAGSKEVAQQQLRKKSGITPTQLRQAIAAASNGNADDRQNAILKAYRGSPAFPKWLPKSDAVMGDDTAAIVASLGSNPSTWSKINFTLNPDRSVTMTISRKGSNQYGPYPDKSVRLPDFEAAQEVGRWLATTTYEGLKVTGDTVGTDLLKRGRIAE